MATHLVVTPSGIIVARVDGIRTNGVQVLGHNVYAISDEGLAILLDEVEQFEEPSVHYRLGERGLRFVQCAIDFREFLKVWYFESNFKKEVMLLGGDLWPGQEQAITAMKTYLRIFSLKARRLGQTTLAVAYDAWVLRFRDRSCRVHLVSRVEKDSKNSLLKPLKFGLRRLPVEMRLPIGQDTATVIELIGGPDDSRIAEAYPAKEPGRGYGANHVHLDEWAAMVKTSPDLPEEVWKSIGPTLNPDSSVHILTTGRGPGYYADVWEEAERKKGEPDEEGIPTLYPCFIRATGSRPDYTPERIKRERAEHGPWEYPENAAEALAGREGTYFSQRELERAHLHAWARPVIPPIYVVYPPCEQHPLFEVTGCEACKLAGKRSKDPKPWGLYKDGRGEERLRRFVKAWDIGGPGEDSDASVGILLDVTESTLPWFVRAIVRLEGVSYPELAYAIEQFHWSYPGRTYIEDNNAGMAVRQFLKLSEQEALGWKTTAQSKGPALRAVKVALGHETLKWPDPDDDAAGHCADGLRHLDIEMGRYILKDAGLKQDCVMALAIAVSVGAEAAAEVAGGRVIRLGIAGSV